MHSYVGKRTRINLALAIVAVVSAAIVLGFPFKQTAQTVAAQQPEPNVPVIAPGSAYRQTNLVSDIPGLASIQDLLLVNPWGISMTSSSPFWIANNGSATSSLYRGDVGSIFLFKQPGMPNITLPSGLPTGTVANTGGTTDFVVTSGSASARANFLFATLTGKIFG